MGARGLAACLDQAPIVARDLLQAHRRTYARFWRWSDHAVMYAMIHSEFQTVFGWPVHVGHVSNPRSLANYPMQANGAERCAWRRAWPPNAIEICAPVHDAFLIMAPLDRIDHDIAAMRAAMAEASRVVLDGFELTTDVSITKYPNRYADPRGGVMWRKVMSELQQIGRIERREAV
jgi:DNA polymerase I